MSDRGYILLPLTSIGTSWFPFGRIWTFMSLSAQPTKVRRASLCRPWAPEPERRILIPFSIFSALRTLAMPVVPSNKHRGDQQNVCAYGQVELKNNSIMSLLSLSERISWNCKYPDNKLELWHLNRKPHWHRVSVLFISSASHFWPSPWWDGVGGHIDQTIQFFATLRKTGTLRARYFPHTFRKFFPQPSWNF